ncbi:MAG TPA: RNA polymerase sigma factor SigX [Virgibacillus sp.]|nr:RNA polymerase sigma factor SigX [Virgibacillus sp.]
MKLAFDKLYEQYHQDLFQFIFYMVGDKPLAEDLVQEVYIRVLNSYVNFRGESSEKTWMFSIARNVTIDYFRKQKRRRHWMNQFFDWDKRGELLEDHQPLPDEIAILNDEIKTVFKYLKKCTPDQRSVLILRFIQSCSIKETAEILNFSVSKVKTTQHRGLKALRNFMSNNLAKGGHHT